MRSQKLALQDEVKPAKVTKIKFRLPVTISRSAYLISLTSHDIGHSLADVGRMICHSF